MARKDQDKLDKSAQMQASKEMPKKVLMRFSTNQFYNNQDVPIFEANKVYPLEGQDWINRWLKRGGEIVENHKGKVAATTSTLPESDKGPDGEVRPLTSGGAEQEIRKTNEEGKEDEKKDQEQGSGEESIKSLDGGNEGDLKQ